MRILASGDWQFGLHDRLADQEAAAEKIVDLALEREVGLFLHGGDVLEGPTVHPEHLRAFRRPLARLRAAGIPVLVATGNGRHDQSMRDATGLDVFGDIPGVQVASRADVYRFDGCMVAALPWVHVGRMVAASNGGDRDNVNERAAELLVRVAAGLLEDCRRVAPELPAVLLPHWSLSGASLPTGLPADAMREPVIDTDALCNLGFDAIVASHIHKPQSFGASGWYVPHAAGYEVVDALALYTGSPICHDFGESNHPHGCWIVDVEQGSSSAEFVPIESRAFVTAEVDFANGEAVSDESSFEDELFGAAHLAAFKADTKLDGAIVRLRYTVTAAQARRIDTTALTAALKEAGAHVVKVEPDIVREDRARVDGVHEDLAPLDAYDLWATSGDLDPALALRARVRLAEHLEAVA